ncbi:MAG: hypothetical protein LJE83_01945 [Gammaproteobacteria bacterium]|jgi:hypothetical protein|nr:hypothetical protein [Gammaproteobacteria bacterium]
MRANSGVLSGRHAVTRNSFGFAVCGLMFFALMLAVSSVHAGDIAELQVTENQGIYSMKMVMLVDAPARYVRDVLTDYTHIYRLNPTITESYVLPSPKQGVTRVKTVISGCVAFFCRDVGRVEDISEQGTGSLLAVIVPELSDLRSGIAEWDIQSTGNQTRVVYQASMEPDFFVPPLVGPFVIKENIRSELLASFNRIECITQIRQQFRTPGHQQMATSRPAACDEHAEDDIKPLL